MAEDQLTRGERIRLEALSQAQGMSGLPIDDAEAQDWIAKNSKNEPVINRTEERVLALAERIESWLKRADDDARAKAN